MTTGRHSRAVPRRVSDGGFTLMEMLIAIALMGVVLPASVRFTIRDAVTERSLAVSTAAVVRVDVPVDCVQQKTKRDCGTSADDVRNKGQPGASKQQASPGGG